MRASEVVLAALLLTACSRPAVVSRPLPSPIVSQQTKHLDAKQLDEWMGGRPDEAYRVGPGDTLLVAVYGHPELAISQAAGAGQLGNLRGAGLVIDNDGSIQFPLVGSVNVEGKTTKELREYLEERLRKFVQAPKVTVQVLFPGKIRYYMLGQFRDPGLKFSDRPLRLLEAIALCGSVDLDSASLRSAYIARGDKRLPVDFRRLILEGDMKQNVPLWPGDVVMVPNSSADAVFVFGGVQGERQGGAVPFVNGRLDILQALAQAGFGFRERAAGILSDTRVIRSEGDRGELFVVDVERILDGEAANFLLAPGDVIFVPTAAITDWNLALQQLLPTLQAMSATLQPFVQIEFLTRDRN
ncbi:MAG: polysaccharide biosynthesis/export family protein [Myxococcales bacterium]|nr:polysaccharide biosynthesis/export family protein [Myxococcales bacterium]MDD9969947.1 polysaccharide biosynthesis/export family protein [Myxococcales bacterium]